MEKITLELSSHEFALILEALNHESERHQQIAQTTHTKHHRYFHMNESRICDDLYDYISSI